jgi:hypothetical protein
LLPNNHNNNATVWRSSVKIEKINNEKLQPKNKFYEFTFILTRGDDDHNNKMVYMAIVRVRVHKR